MQRSSFELAEGFKENANECLHVFSCVFSSIDSFSKVSVGITDADTDNLAQLAHLTYRQVELHTVDRGRKCLLRYSSCRGSTMFHLTRSSTYQCYTALKKSGTVILRLILCGNLKNIPSSMSRPKEDEHPGPDGSYHRLYTSGHYTQHTSVYPHHNII